MQSPLALSFSLSVQLYKIHTKRLKGTYSVSLWNLKLLSNNIQTLCTEHHWILRTLNYLRLVISADLKKSQLWETRRLVQASDRVKLGIRSWSVPTWHWPICHFLDSECIIHQHQNPEGLLRPHLEFPRQALELWVSNPLPNHAALDGTLWEPLLQTECFTSLHLFFIFPQTLHMDFEGLSLKGDYFEFISSDVQWLYIAHLYMPR